jgi:hypothetical protein
MRKPLEENFQDLIQKLESPVYVANTYLRMRKYPNNPLVRMRGLSAIAYSTGLTNNPDRFLNEDDQFKVWRFLIAFCQSEIGKSAIAKAKTFPRYSSVA